MCGIAGIVQPAGKPVDVELVDRMTNTLRHRGPDAWASHIDGNVGLGHRRLSVIDTSEVANQPMFNEDGKVAVVFNGEIYNFRELRRELQSLGHYFHTNSDTEVIVHGWEEFGPACVERFRGMFAFAIYDARNSELFLARDRLGKKPLYYILTPEQMAFASELKALRLADRFDSELDLDGLGEYVSYGNTLGERTIYRKVRRLPPAHYMRVSLADAQLDSKPKRYWQIVPVPDDSCSEDQWLDRLDDEISEAVRLRMISDVPLGAFLSGGIDSSLIVAYMAKYSSEPVQTFTMGFNEGSHDESSYAREVALHLGVEHQVQVVKPRAIDVLDHLIDAYDEPFADQSAIPTFYLSEMTRRNVTVALSGDGGDEIFLGYSRYPYSLWMNRFGRCLTPVGRGLAEAVSRRMDYSARFRRPLNRLARRDFDLYHHAMGYRDEMLDLLRADVRAELSKAETGKMAADFRRCTGAAMPDRFALTDLNNYLPDDILVKVDRASMHHSLEVRCPLLDHKVVELSASIPWRLKMRGLTGKLLLRKLLGRFVPDNLINRPKRGFGVPLAAWFRHQLKGDLEEMVSDSRCAIWQYFDRQSAQQRLRDHLTGRVDLHASLWRLLFFHRWANRHLGVTEPAGARR